jgi:hypothetical protein
MSVAAQELVCRRQRSECSRVGCDDEAILPAMTSWSNGCDPTEPTERILERNHYEFGLQKFSKQMRGESDRSPAATLLHMDDFHRLLRISGGISAT